MTCRLLCEGNSLRVFIPSRGVVLLRCSKDKSGVCPKLFNKFIADCDCVVNLANPVDEETGFVLTDVAVYGLKEGTTQLRGIER